jgi:glycosyltransferase involved in cell wall biosynthesis
MISILIPLYNGIEFLEQSLTSVINQTYKDWELIIGINGHPPNSFIEKKANNLVQTYNSNSLFHIQVIYYETKGKPATLNKMVDDSKGDYIAILDVDDYWLPEKLENQLPYLYEYDVIGTHCQYFGDSNNYPNIPFGDISKFDFFLVNPIINSSVLIRKELANWDEENIYYFVDDYDLWFKLYSLNKKFFNIKKVLCMHRSHKNSMFNNTIDGEEKIISFKEKWFNIIHLNSK